MIAITHLYTLPSDHLAELVAESQQAGFRFMRRLIEEWESGANQFTQPGEVFLAAQSGPRIVGVCGLNRDPYAASSNVGRIRRLYVLKAFRRQGVGRCLVEELITASRGVFHQLRLYTDTEQAARFYAALGFQPCVGTPKCTHLLNVVSEPLSD